MSSIDKENTGIIYSDKEKVDDLLFWNVDLDFKNESESSNKLSEAVYFFLKDKNSNIFFIEPAQIVYAVANYVTAQYFVPRLYPVEPGSRVKFYDGIENAINSFNFASYKEGSIEFGNYRFFRPVQTKFMTLVKADIVNLISDDGLSNDYEQIFSSVCDIYRTRFFKDLGRGGEVRLLSDFRDWFNKNKVFEVDTVLYYPHFSYRDSVGLEEFKK